MDAVPVLDTQGGQDKEPTTHEGCGGDVWLGYVPELNGWLSTSHCGNKILANLAENPWGPWSDATPIFTPEGGYCYFMYNKQCPCLDDSCGDNRCGSGKIAGAYGPYVIRWQSDNQGGVEVDYLLSTWNPYNVMQLRTHLKRE